MPPLGKLVTEMALDDKQFQDSLKKNEALVEILKRSLGDLSNIKIGDGGKIIIDPAQAQKSAQSLQQLRAELVRLKAEIEGKPIGSDTFNILKAQIGQVENQIKSATIGVEKNKEKLGLHRREVTEGEKAFRGYIREQRLQDRAFREGTQVILGITTALSLLSQGSDKGSESVKKIERSLLATVVAINTVEFAFFSLGQMGNKVGGTVGGTLSKIAGFAGPISIFLGVGAGLIAFFQSTNEEAGKAADEGLKKFNEEFSKLGKLDRDITSKNIDDRIKALRAERDALVKTPESSLDPEFKAGRKGPVISDQAKYDDLTKRITLLAEYKDGIADTEKLESELKLIEEERNRVLVQNLSIIEKINKEIKDAEDKREKSKSASEIQALTDKIAGLQKQREALLKSTNELNREALESQRKSYEEEKKFYDNRQKAIEDNVQEYVQLVNLGYEVKSITADTAILELRKAEAVAKSAGNKTLELQIQQQIQRIQGETARIQEEAARKQEQALERQMDQVQRVGNLLERAFSKGGDDFISKLNQALQIAVNIARVVSNMNKKEEGGSPLDFLEIFATFAQLALLKDGAVDIKPRKYADGEVNVDKDNVVHGPGGPTGDKIPALISDGESITSAKRTAEYRETLKRIKDGTLPKVFEKKYADGNIGLMKEVFSNNTVTARERITELAPKYLSGGGSYTAQDISPIIDELRMLRGKVGELQTSIENMPTPQITMPEGLVTIDDALIQATPRVEKHFAQKNVD